LVKAVIFTPEQREEDKIILEKILEFHNEYFRDNLQRYSEHADVEGFSEKTYVDKGSHVVSFADLHSDLMTLLALLDLLVETKFCDNKHRVRKDMQILQLGDISDRGPNWFETLSIALLLRIINRDNVHFLRGNHEDVEVNLMYGEDQQWVKDHRESLTLCYQTLPVTFRIAEREGRLEKGGRKEALHATHGLFSTLIDPFEPEKLAKPYYVIRRNPPPTERIIQLSFGDGVAGRETKHSIAAGAVIALQEIEKNILEERRRARSPICTPLGMHLWSDVDEGNGFFVASEQRGLLVSPDMIRLSMQCGCTEICDKFLIRGHFHFFEEMVGGGKVFGTTLPAAPVGGFLFPLNRTPLFIGLLYIVAPRMKEWRKRPIYLEEMTRMVLGKRDFGMYESLKL
jgi:hypothetical protein